MATRGSKRATTEQTGGDVKRQRQGVGTSVVDLIPGPVDDFALLLLKVKAERLRPKGKGEVITVTRMDPLPYVSKLLLDNNILSVPVLNNSGQFYGFLEQKDIVRYIINVLFRDFSETQYANIDKLFSNADMFGRTVVADVMEYPVRLRSPNFAISKGSSLYTAWEILAREGTHRIPVIDSERKIVDILTQSMMIDFLWQNIEKIGEVANRQVRSLFGGYVNSEVLSIDENDKAYNAFKEMVRARVPGIAVLSHGRLVDNISLRDFKRTHTDARTFWRLWDTVKDFKAQNEQEHPPLVPFKKPLYVEGSDTLYSVIEKMALNHVHRIYEVADTTSMVPVRVITQTDVLNAILICETEAKE